MATDLETAIRDALRHRAQTVTQQELRQPALRRPEAHASARGRWLAVAASVLAVLALAVSVGLLATRAGSHDRNGQTASGLPRALGYQWRLTTVETVKGRTAVPSSLRATVTFTRDGMVLGDDTVNALQASYRRTATGYLPGDAASSGVGMTGTDQLRQTVIDAIDGLFFTVTRSLTATPPEFEVAVRVVGDTLTLSTKGTTTTFTRNGAAPNYGPASPTPTRTAPAGPRPTGSFSPGSASPG